MGSGAAKDRGMLLSDKKERCREANPKRDKQSYHHLSDVFRNCLIASDISHQAGAS